MRLAKLIVTLFVMLGLTSDCQPAALNDALQGSTLGR
jgi:hypothetical protein